MICSWMAEVTVQLATQHDADDEIVRPLGTVHDARLIALILVQV